VGKKRSAIEVLESGTCPDCGGKIELKDPRSKKALSEAGYTHRGGGFYGRGSCSQDDKKPDQTAQDKVEAKEKKRGGARWRARNLKLAEKKRSKRNLMRLEIFKSRGLRK